MTQLGEVPASEERRRRRPTFHHSDTVNFHPHRDDYRSGTFLQEYVLKGWLPDAPFVTRQTQVTAFGSCFAANITRHLSSRGYDLSADRDPDVYISRMGDGMVNMPAILGQFEWVLENKKPLANLWHGFDAEKYGLDEDIRLRTQRIFLTTDLFIITLGLSEIWYDEPTGSTFWRAVPEQFFDPGRHKFRVLSTEETRAGIAEMHRLVRLHVPAAKILFTVSPIPLAATFRPISCLTANAVSKAVIRAALDEFIRSKPLELNKSLFYFPSMELVQLGFPDPWKAELRHPKSYVLDTVMKAFEAAYCVGESTFEEAHAMFQMFRLHNFAEIADSLTESGTDAETFSAARKAYRTGRKARRQAKAEDRAVPRNGNRRQT